MNWASAFPSKVCEAAGREASLVAVLEGGSGAQRLEETAVSSLGHCCWFGLCGSHSAVCAHRLLHPPSTSSTRELLVVGSVGPSLPDRVGLLGFQEPGGILPVSCLEKQGADCGPPSLRSRVGCGSSPAAKDEGGSPGCLLLA